MPLFNKRVGGKPVKFSKNQEKKMVELLGKVREKSGNFIFRFLWQYCDVLFEKHFIC